MTDASSPLPDLPPTPSQPVAHLPADGIDYLFLLFIIGIVLLDTLLLALVKIDTTMLPIFAAFVSSTAVAPLAAWAGYRYGSSQGSKAKDDVMVAAVQKATE